MKIPSPCISVCKFKNAGYCVGCGMTKKQKKKFKRLEGRKKKLRFIEALRIQQQEVGLKANWERAYRRRCRKKGVDCPLDRAEAPASSELPPPPPVPAPAQ
ncbi:hypothetical protein APY04_1482 [Hyphomicrobium sulfonivorans]|uniref:DUF1289 domain-containing protein n=2 Tax=Hyphomicrobium sulfonivorans TaxID=121290 RepID=A0A109BIQ3_HYPSL|nr:DUF1289 domain-containing protein [Hyphomicrobium sulfonivorans]KWT69399.1 hypothetical protein APY04_1482 [Hyphomicrobium sulfonivorans]